MKLSSSSCHCTIITNYCFSAISKKCLNLSSSPTAINTSQFDNCQSFVVMFAPKTKFPSFGAALPFPSTINTNYCFSAISKKCLNLSSSPTAINTCPENKISDFWRRYPFQIQLLQTIAFLQFWRRSTISNIQLTTASRSVVMFAPKTKFPSFGAALPFPSTIITNYCFSAILKKCWLPEQSIPHSLTTASRSVTICLPFPSTEIQN